MILSDIERHSALWKKINEYVVAQIATLRARNDGDLNETETAALRGQIRFAKKLLALGEPPRPSEVADEQ